MNCIICRQAEFVEGFTSIPFERDEFRLIVHHIPALICPFCGEAIVDEETAQRLLRMAEETVEQGIQEDVQEYGR